MGLETVFQEMFNECKTRQANATLNPYGGKCFVEPPITSTFPSIVITLMGTRLKGETLTKTEKKYGITVEVNIYTQDASTVNHRDIANQLSDFINDIFDIKYGLTLENRQPTPNIDMNVYRINARYSGVYDMNTKKIYRE